MTGISKRNGLRARQGNSVTCMPCWLFSFCLVILNLSGHTVSCHYDLWYDRHNLPCLGHSEERVPSASMFPSKDLEPMPTQVSTLLYGPHASLYISETLSACREMNSSMSLIIEMLVQV